MRRIDLYIVKQIIKPLLMTLGVAAMLLLLERMLRLFDFVVNQGGPVEVVFRLLGNLVPHYLGLALPIGLFLGILVAFRELSMSSELDAMQSSGVGLPRLMRPVMALSIFLMLIDFVLVGYIQPFSRYSYHGLMFDLRSGALGASVRVGEFVSIGRNIVLRIEESKNSGTELVGIFLERKLANGRTVVITADHGGFFSTPDQQNVILRLFDGRLVDTSPRQAMPRVLTFERQDLTIPLPSVEAFRARGQEQLELTVHELWLASRDPTLTPGEHNRIVANLHWRLGHSLTFLILPLLAVALGVTNRRSGNSLGLFVGLTMIIVFNEVLEVGENMVADGRATPLMGIWSLFGLFALLALRFLYVRAFKVGGNPLYWIDLIVTIMTKPVKTVTRKVTEAIT